MSRYEVRLGDCREQLRELGDATIDAIVTDPPYELGFMGKGWDSSGIAYDVGLWREALRVLKPGGHLLAFGAARTYHRVAVAIEDAGFEIRDSISWIRAGQSMPKSLDVSKALDRAAGARGAEGRNMRTDGGIGTASYRATVDPRDYVRPPPVTDAAKTWLGWGTSLKPASEPIVVARKPLDGTVAANVLAHGVGGINVDGCRVSGRWPPNAVFSHLPACDLERCSEGCAVAELDAQGGTRTSGTIAAHHRRTTAGGNGRTHGAMAGVLGRSFGDSGGASRFFPAFRYQAKPSRRERGPAVNHPTVKPVELMRWLVRLVTPKGGTVLDPFAGSGTTGVAAVLEDARFVGVELSEEYRRIAVARIEAAQAGRAGEQLDLFDLEETTE